MLILATRWRFSSLFRHQMALFKKNREKCKFWPPDGTLVHFFATRGRSFFFFLKKYKFLPPEGAVFFFFFKNAKRKNVENRQSLLKKLEKCRFWPPDGAFWKFKWKNAIFCAQKAFFRKISSEKGPILTLLSKKVWKTWILKKKFTEMRIFTKNAFFGHQMALFQEKLRNFGDFWMIFWQILKFLTKILHLLGKNLDFDWLSSKILTDICFEIKRDNFHAWSTWFVQCLPPDGVFLKILSEKRPILTLLLKKMFERHGFWRKKLQKWELGHWFTSDFLKI